MALELELEVAKFHNQIYTVLLSASCTAFFSTRVTFKTCPQFPVFTCLLNTTVQLLLFGFAIRIVKILLGYDNTIISAPRMVSQFSQTFLCRLFQIQINSGLKYLINLRTL